MKIMTRLDQLAQSLLRPINPSIIVILGVYTIIWGLWVVNPFWSVFSHAGLYSALSMTGGEYIWGGIVLIAGLLITHGALKPSYNNLVRGSSVGFIIWLVVAIFYFIGDWASTGGITALTFSIYCLLVHLNIKVNKTHFIRRIRK